MSGDVCLGGTFNRMHAGHLSMLSLAFSLGGKVYIGLTSDEMAGSSRSAVRPYEDRRRSLARACSRYGGRFEIGKLSDPYGYSTRVRGLGAIVVSEATRFRVQEINSIRAEKGFRQLESHVVPLLRTVDGMPLSSTRILSGECDRNGRLLRKLNVGIGSKNPVKVGAVRDVFRTFAKELGAASFRPADPERSVPEQPFSVETMQGALSRARLSLRGNDLGVGIEAGLFSVGELGAVYDVQYCVVVDRAGTVTSGHGMGFSYPSSVLAEVARGRTIGDVISEVSGIDGVGRKGGAIGYLSHGKMGRRELTRQAVMSAMLPRLNPRLYRLGEGADSHNPAPSEGKRGAEGEI